MNAVTRTKKKRKRKNLYYSCSLVATVTECEKILQHPPSAVRTIIITCDDGEDDQADDRDGDGKRTWTRTDDDDDDRSHLEELPLYFLEKECICNISSQEVLPLLFICLY